MSDDAMVMPYSVPSRQDNHALEDITTVCDYLKESSDEELYLSLGSTDPEELLDTPRSLPPLQLENLDDSGYTVYDMGDDKVAEFYSGGERLRYGRLLVGDLSMVEEPLEEIPESTEVVLYLSGEEQGSMESLGNVIGSLGS